MVDNWSSLFSAAVSGGVVVKCLDYGVEWLKSNWQHKRNAKAVVDSHLDPLLKAADELAGKTTSLAKRDFTPLYHANSDEDAGTINPDLMGLLYLYAKFWSRIEILETDSLGVSMASDTRGVALKEFVTCLESPQIRLVDRIHQKAIGEITTTVLNDGTSRTIGVVEFTDRVLTDETAKSWIQPLLDLLASANIKARRQRLLSYGVVIHAFVDALDPSHHTTHPRPSYPNKLSKKSRRQLEHGAFKLYLPSVKDYRCYLQKT